MITEVEKHLFVGHRSLLDLFFERAQELGIVEFTNGARRLNVVGSPDVDRVYEALKILKKQPIKGSYHGEYEEKLALDVAFEILEKRNILEKLEIEIASMRAEKARVEPFGLFSMEDVRALEVKSSLHVHFFCMKCRSYRDLGERVFYIGTDFGLDYFISLDKKPFAIENAIEMHVTHSALELKKLIDRMEKQMASHAARLHDLSIYIPLLEEALLHLTDAIQLSAAKKLPSTQLEGRLFATSGWVSISQLTELHKLVDDMGIIAKTITPDPGEVVPTALENQGLAAVGEDLVHIYDTPSTTDKDPSLWVLWSFVLFFSMIIADGGYGLVFLLIAFVFKKKCKTAPLKRFIKMLTMVSLGCISWGFLTGSFFGLDLGVDSPFNKASFIEPLLEKKAAYHMEVKDDVYEEWTNRIPKLKQIEEPRQWIESANVVIDGETHRLIETEFRQNILLELSLLIGSIHVILSFLRNLRRNYAGIGWILFIMGGYLYFPDIIHATSFLHFMHILPKETAFELGLQLLYCGMAMASVFSLIQNKLKGAHEIMNAVSVFTDVLSYLRLYALGIAGTLMAETFNKMGEGIGFFFGFLVILLGHLINILLASMSGVIHGLRLNFLEWYHWSFEGGGRRFSPLKKLTKK